MGFELSIALRHLTSKKIRSGIVSIITFISILGVVVGVTALIAVLAVMDGAQNDYMKRLIDQYAHIEVWPRYTPHLGNYEPLLELIQANPEVKAASPIISIPALLQHADERADIREAMPAYISGIDAELESDVSLMSGKSENFTGKSTPENNEIVLGKQLAVKLRATLGSRLKALSPKFADTVTMGDIPKTKWLTVCGIFESGIYEMDLRTAYVALPAAREMNLIEDQSVVDMIHMSLEDPSRADIVREQLSKDILAKFGTECRLRTWGEMNEALFVALKLEKLAMFVILMLVVIVAGLNIIGTLILITMEKTREIGILRAMGVPRRSITRIFIYEGTIIGFIGTTLGIIFGLALCWYLDNYFPIDIPEAVYGLDGLPVLVKPLTILIIAASSMAICLLSAVLPAFLAARLNVVEALRYE